VRAQRPPNARPLLRQRPSGRLQIDRRKLAAEARLDGKFLLSTSDPDLSAQDVALGYKNLLEAERGFRDLKTTLELRPVVHRLEHRIRAHVLLSWLALLLIRLAERQTGRTWRRIALELQRLHLVTLTGATGTVEQTTQLTDSQRDLSPRRRHPAAAHQRPAARLTRPAGAATPPHRPRERGHTRTSRTKSPNPSYHADSDRSA
jgi:hypothetical protein